MNRLTKFIMGSIFAIVAVAVLSAAALISFTDDPWVQFDRSVESDNLAPGPALSAENPARIAVEVPSLGLDRIDVRFHLEPAAADQRARDGEVEVRLEDESGEEIWRSDLALSIVPNDEWAQLSLPHIARTDHEVVTMVLTPQGIDDDAKVSIWELACDCVAMSRLTHGPAGAPVSTSDADAAYFANVPSRMHRARVVLDRINRTHPKGFGSQAVIGWTLVAGACLIALTAMLIVAARRPDEHEERSPEDRAR